MAKVMLQLSANIRPAEDGCGFVAQVVEIDNWTWGETLDEMSFLIVDMVRTFFESERARGTLGQTLRALLERRELPASYALPPTPVVQPVSPTIETTLLLESSGLPPQTLFMSC